MTQIELILPWGRQDRLDDLSRLFLPYFLWFSDSAHSFETPWGLILFSPHVIFKLVQLHWLQYSFSSLSCSKCEKNQNSHFLHKWRLGLPSHCAAQLISWDNIFYLFKAGNISDLSKPLYYFSKNLSPIIWSKGKKRIQWKYSLQFSVNANFFSQCISLCVEMELGTEKKSTSPTEGSHSR